MGKAWKLQLFEQLPRMEHHKPQEKLENGQKKTIERMETATFSAVWQKPPKAKENLENCRGNKPCAICLYVVTCTNSAGNLEITTFSAFLAKAAQSKGQPRKLQRNPLKGWIWQKPPKAKENLENCGGNKPCAICLYAVTCSNSAGNLGNGRMKLGLVPLAQ